jgi:hypothetical protein
MLISLLKRKIEKNTEVTSEKLTHQFEDLYEKSLKNIEE